MDQIDVKLFDSKRSSIVELPRQVQGISLIDVEDAVNAFMTIVYRDALKQLPGAKELSPPTSPTKRHLSGKSLTESPELPKPQEYHSPTFADDDETGRYNYQSLAIQQGVRNSPLKMEQTAQTETMPAQNIIDIKIFEDKE